MKQTAVEYLIKRLENLNLIKDGDLENELFRQIEVEAKEMEKQQIVEFAENYELYESDKYPRKTFEQYYNETYKNNNT